MLEVEDDFLKDQQLLAVIIGRKRTQHGRKAHGKFLMCLSLSLSCGCSVFDYVCLLIMSVCCWYWQHDLIPVLCQEGGAQRSCGFWAVGHDMNSPCVCLWRMDMKTCLQREADHNQVAVRDAHVNLHLVHDAFLLSSFQTDACWPAALRGAQTLKLYVHESLISSCVVCLAGLDPERHLGKSLAEMEPYLHEVRDTQTLLSESKPASAASAQVFHYDKLFWHFFWIIVMLFF